MKKLLGILVLGLLLILNVANAKITNFKKGQTYEGEIFWSHISFQLPPGKWEIIDKWGWSVNMIRASGVDLILLEGNIIRAIISFTVLETQGKWIGYLNQWIYENIFQNKYDGCYERSEYYLVKVFKKGASINCLIIRHDEPKKEIFQPDDPEDKVWSAMWRKYLRENNVKLPPITVSSDHIYYAPVVQNKLIAYWYAIDPEFHGGPRSEFTLEASNEFHRSNIDKYPDHKKYMEDWVKKSAQRHKLFEEKIKAKSYHKLDLSEYVKGEIIEETKTTSSSLTGELIELNKLYEEGILTKEEFEKAKKKVLSQ
jgi:hypothetical protein|tara:strand:+ start:10 stop:945 length:936 start_codon:yes stop_codon:yes gene_type:complete